MVKKKITPKRTELISAKARRAMRKLLRNGSSPTGWSGYYKGHPPLKEMLLKYEEDDPTFVQDLLDSQSHVIRVGNWLEMCGYEVEIADIKVRDDVRNMAKFADNGDLFVSGNRLEAKQRMLDFTSREDFPYPTIIVDVAHTWDKADQKPLAYILTNKETSCALVVLGSTFEHWKKVNKWDRQKKRHRTFYECPIDRTLFYKLDEKCDLDWLTSSDV